MKYFVMAISPSINFRDHPEPIEDDDANMALFDTKEEAEEMAKKQMLCRAGGYEIFEWPYIK